MEVVILLIFVSLVLVACAVAFFAWNVSTGSHDHAERLALLPLRDDRTSGGAPRSPTPGALEPRSQEGR